MTSSPNHHDPGRDIARCAWHLLLRILHSRMAGLCQHSCSVHLPQTRVKFSSCNLLQPESKGLAHRNCCTSSNQSRRIQSCWCHTFNRVYAMAVSAGAGCNALCTTSLAQCCTTSLAQCALHDIAGAMRSARLSLACALHDIAGNNALCTA
jgi:hypothetical protein